MSLSDEAAWQLVTTLPGIGAMDPANLEWLRARAVRRQYGPGAMIAGESEPPDRVFFLVAGEISITRDGKLVTLVEGPEVVGLIAVLDGGARTASVGAFTAVDVFELSATDFRLLRDRSRALDEFLLRLFATQLRRLYREASTVERHFEDFFRSPKAELVPGPYEAAPFDMFVFVMNGPPERIAKLMPPGVRPIPLVGGRYLLTFNFFNRTYSRAQGAEGLSFQYNETASFMPCIGPGPKPGLFVPELYPDNFLAITLGRELYGFPKRFAKTVYSKEKRRIDMVLGRQMTLRSTWAGEQVLSADAFMEQMVRLFWPVGTPPKFVSRAIGRVLGFAHGKLPDERLPPMPVYVHKQIPDVEQFEQNVLQIDELVEIPFHVFEIGDFKQLELPQTQFLDSEYFLSGSRCLAAFRLRMGLRFGKGAMRKDYIERKRSLWDRVKGGG